MDTAHHEAMHNYPSETPVASIKFYKGLAFALLPSIVFWLLFAWSVLSL